MHLCSHAMSLDLDAYRAQAEEFLSETDREYYLHYSGQRDEFQIDEVFERHSALFTREAADSLRDAGAPRELVEFAVEGHIGRETRQLAAGLARREAALEIEWDGEPIPYRAVAVLEANEPDADRRAALDAARNELTRAELNPLLLELLERTHAITGELGWSSVRAMCEELSGIDLGALGEQTATFLADTEEGYEDVVAPCVHDQLGLGFGELRRSDLPAFFRAPALDSHFPTERLVRSLTETLSEMGIEVSRQRGVTIDTAPRPKKSPRAFCSPVRVPDEVYLVISPVGGREDYAALFHEAGHTEHYAHTDPALPVEHRYRGDNSVTEAYAFLFEHLTDDPAWLRHCLGVEDTGAIEEHSRASKLVFTRRYAAKLAYELALQGGGPVEGLDAVYARELTDALHVQWPCVTWLSDVDPFFYSARYLRAWALETHLRRALVERFGAAWFAEPAAGHFLRELWGAGQGPEGGEGVLAAAGGDSLDFSALLEDLAVRP